MDSFTELTVWKHARDLRKEVSKIAANLPAYEKSRLEDQLIRTSRSVTANIAEGYGRYHFQENIQFCRHSRGSLQELLDHFICAMDEKYITREQFKDLANRQENTLKLLNGYIGYLQRAKKQSKTNNQ